MQRFMVMDEKKEGDGGGAPKVVVGYVAEEPKKEAAPTVDDFGYGIKVEGDSKDTKIEAAGDTKDTKKEEPPKEKEIVAATGYEEAPPKIEEPKKEAAPESAVEAAKELDIDVKDLPEDDAKSIKAFAKKHGVSKEVAQDLADMKKAEHQELNVALENRREEIKREQAKRMNDWHNELKNDPTFGGEKFAYSIKQAEKVIDQFMPNLKSQLIQNKQMLPPYVMKDLAKLAKHLYSSEGLTQGDPIVQTKANDEKEDHLAFYT